MSPSRVIAFVVALLVAVGAVVVIVAWPGDNDGVDTPPSQVTADDRPNVLIVVWDTVRADRMSLYGHDVATTPQLDAFAQEARVYEQAIAPGMWTLPTHATMFTGLYPQTHGARAGYRWLDYHHPTLAELLRDVGYDTFFFSSNLIAGPMTNLAQGFDTVHTTYPRKGQAKRKLWPRYVELADAAARAKLIERDASTELSPSFAGSKKDHWKKAAFKDAAPVITQGLFEWLDTRDRASPWLAYLNFMEAHTPRVPSMEARKRILDDATIELGLKTNLSLFAENEFMIGQRSYTDEELKAIAGVYDATLVDLDDATATLFAGLQERGVLDDTLVVVVADHGEHLGEHGRFEHRWSMHQELLHVPLLMRLPGVVEPGRVSERVSTGDVFSTVLEVTGTTAPPSTQTQSLLATDRSGQVFSQLLDPFASQLKNVREAYEDHPDVDFAPLLRTYCAAFEGDDKLIFGTDGDHALYDLGADPQESTNRAATDPERVAYLSDALFAFENARPLYSPSFRSPADRRSKAPAQSRAEAAELEQMLADIGYIGDGDNGGDEDIAGYRTRCTDPGR